MTAEQIKIYQTIANYLQEKDHFLITTHVRPDGDSVSSALVLSTILDSYGKQYHIVLDDCIPKKLHYLLGIEKIHKYQENADAFSHHAVIILDSSDTNRIGQVKQLFHGNETIINIDHHPGNTYFGDLNMVDSTKSSTVEVVYPLVDFTKTKWTSALATMVYTGILSDTGRFLFANTSSDAMFICAEMVKQGADPSFISEMLYNRSSPETMRALAKALSSLEFNFDDQVTCMHLDSEYLCHSGTVDTEGFVDTITGIEGVKASFFMMERDDQEFRVSFRSKGEVDVNEVAGSFGGGGHVRASGANIDGTLEQVKQKVLKVIKRHLSQETEENHI
ncbi:bifunctional oligoribonuclease/PAP phosphatase NrnA [bacterium]